MPDHLPVRLLVVQDEDCPNPLEDCGEWKLTRFLDCRGQAESALRITKEARRRIDDGERLRIGVDDVEPVCPLLRGKVRRAQAFIVSCYRHGGEYWFIPGVRADNHGLPYLQHDAWDTTPVAGLLEWTGDPADMPRLHADRRRWAAAALEEYNLWVNGDAWYYVIEYDDPQDDESCGGILGWDALRDCLKTEHPDLWGPDGSLLPHLELLGDANQL